MKKIKFLALCLCAVLTGLYFVSCNKTNKSIVGTWDSSEVSENSYMMFCSDGIGYTFEEYKDGELGEVSKYEYTHNAASGALTIKENDGATTGTAVVNGDTMTLSFTGISGAEKGVTLKKATVKATRETLEKAYEEQHIN